MMKQQWQERQRPARLERRYEFAEYSALSDFLESAAALSEEVGFYPDMGFGRDYVNITIHAEEGSGILDQDRRLFAQRLDELCMAEAGG